MCNGKTNTIEYFMIDDDRNAMLSTRSGSESSRPCIVQIRKRNKNYNNNDNDNIARITNGIILLLILCIFVFHIQVHTPTVGTWYDSTINKSLSPLSAIILYQTSFGTVSARHILSPLPGVVSSNAIHSITTE